MAIDRSRLITSLLLIIVVVLIGQVYWQSRRITQMQASMEFQQRQFAEQVDKLAADKLKNNETLNETEQSAIKTAFNKPIRDGGFWNPDRNWYIYWREPDNSIHGDNPTGSSRPTIATGAGAGIVATAGFFLPHEQSPHLWYGPGGISS
mgnify:CR=1 FL=1